jgi:multiple sugar transport system permease protein
MKLGISTAHSVVEPSVTSRIVAGVLVALYAFITIVPLAWIILTAFKTPADSISYPPKVVFEPSTEGFCNLFTTRSRQTPEYIAQLPPANDACERQARADNMVVVGQSKFVPRFVNSLIIAVGSTVLAVGLGVT